MLARRLFIGGNWKCNNTLAESRQLVESVYNKISFSPEKVDVMCAPISLHLQEVKGLMGNNVIVCAQNSSLTGTGAYTGEIAPAQIKDFGLQWTILGHSERRSYFGENDEVVAQKTGQALAGDLSVVLCIGEQAEDRQSGQTNAVIERQMAPVWEQVGTNWDRIVIAYEPVWAIGTGLVATPQQAQDTHAYIRQLVGEKVSQEVAQQLRIIYGGSVKGANCEGLIGLPDIDGFLVGGASLSADFQQIVEKSQATLA